MNNKTNSIVAELNSRFTDQISNEFRASATFVRDHRDVAYQGPTIQIDNVAGADQKTMIKTAIGTEFSSGANSFRIFIHSKIMFLGIREIIHLHSVRIMKSIG